MVKFSKIRVESIFMVICLLGSAAEVLLPLKSSDLLAATALANKSLINVCSC